MSSQSSIADAKQSVQKALKAFPTNRAVQVKDQKFYEQILLQVRAVLDKKQPPEGSQERMNLLIDIGALEKVIEVKTRYVAFLDEHMAAFQKGLETGAMANEGQAMHWDAASLIKYVEDDEKKYLERVEGFKTTWEVAIEYVNPAWVKAFGEMYVDAGKKEDEVLAEGVKGLDLKADKGEEEKDVEAEGAKAQTKAPGRLKGKARKAAKKAAGAKK